MSDICVTVPKTLWNGWIAEGDLPGSELSGTEYGFTVSTKPNMEPGERVYIVAHGKLRGYAPLVRIETVGEFFGHGSGYALVRTGGAVAVTIPEQIIGFMGWHYRWWPYEEEREFPEWRTP